MLRGGRPFDASATDSRCLRSAPCARLDAPRGSLPRGARAPVSKLCQVADDAHAVQNVTREVRRPPGLLHGFTYSSRPHRRPASQVYSYGVHRGGGPGRMLPGFLTLLPVSSGLLTQGTAGNLAGFLALTQRFPSRTERVLSHTANFIPR